MSFIDAPPIARHGLPKIPDRKRRETSAWKLFDRAVRTLKSMNNRKVREYTLLRPIEGISLRGPNIIGPMPSSKWMSIQSDIAMRYLQDNTNIESGRLASCVDMPKAALTAPSFPAYIVEAAYVTDLGRVVS